MGPDRASAPTGWDDARIAGRRAKTDSPPRKPLTTRQRIVFPIFALVLGVAFALVIAEVGLQIAASRTAQQIHLTDDIPAPDEDAYRVFAVGDSWVYGAESEDHEAFIQVFKRAVEEETGETVQIYNFGESASNSSQALVKLHTHIEAVRPHLVVVLTGANNMLHDKAVEEAARIMGEDPRLSGIQWLKWSRLYGWARLRKVQRAASSLEAITPDPVLELLYGVGGEDPGGGTGLPPAPADLLPGALVGRWEWWDSYARRDWKQMHPWVANTDPKTDAPEATGLLRAWEALALAHLGRHDEAAAMAEEALRLGGDDAAAYEALAVVAEQQDRALHAIQYRIRIASRPPGSVHPWLQARARGLVLLELEAWEAAEAWLMACERQQPGSLEVLLGLSRLPTATRAAAVGEALARGPRGRVTQLEYYRWHEVSSGMVDRMVDSLGQPDDDEPAAMHVGRGRSALVQSRPEEAEAWFRSALAHPEATRVDRARARSGLIGMARDAAQFEALLGVPPEAVELSASNAAAMVHYHTSQDDCDSAVRTGQEGLALGLAPFAFEEAALSCLSLEVGWSLVEQALGYGPVLDRAAMVLGQAPGSLSRFVTPPPVPFWTEFRERDFEAVLADSSGAWKGLALAQLDRFVEAAAALQAAEDASDDAAVIAFGRMLLAKRRGDVTGAMIQGAISATSEGGDPWIRTVARGITLADALHWRQAQVELLSALAAAPGYLEALEALSMVPQPLRYPASEVALRYTPSGRVDADRWSAWYLLQGREEEALRALQWPDFFLVAGDEAAARRAIALGDVRGVQGDKDAAREAYAQAMSLAQGLDDRHLFCRAAARRVRAVGEEAEDEEVLLMSGACGARPELDPPEREHPEAVDAKGRLAALRSDCSTVADLAERSLVAGADPSDISEWMGGCAAEASVATFILGETGGAPPEARAWLLHRVQPGDGDELPGVGEELTKDMLVRQLAAMAALARDQGADFVALTYPFPGAHHQRLRDRVIAEAPRAGVTILDLYGHFAETYSDAEWQALRTKENHVKAEGYETMGVELFEHVRRGGRLPR